MTTPTGILIIDKPLKLTSMGVCSRIRRRLVAGGAPKRVKVGHAGTLDPLATGVLVVLVGKATRLSNQYMAGEKGYAARVDLSAFSPTDDREGQREEVRVDQPPSREAIDDILRGFVGDIQQTPPVYSAMKVDGQRAYKLARKGEIPKLEPRTVTIHEIRVEAYEFPMLELDIRCAKGVYIRSLARDIGGRLGTGGMLDALRRTRVGPFDLTQSVLLDDLPEVMTQENLIPIAETPGHQAESQSSPPG